MFKVIAVAMLVITIIGAAGVAVYDSSKPNQVEAQNSPAVTPAAAVPTQVTGNGNQNRNGSDLGTQTQLLASEVGEPWTASGVIVSIDDIGFELAIDGTGDIVYVELGPTAYWQSQGITLNVAESVMVAGFTQAGLYHAAVVTKLDGSQIAVRDTVSGQPLWSGGAAGGQSDGTQTPQTQVAAEDWITVEGVVTAVAQNSLTIETTGAESLTFQLGRPGFAAEQGVNFAVGDQVRVIGYNSVGQFHAGEIDNLAQGGRLMLLDPNGRPLWAGLGSASGQSQGGQSQGGQSQGGQGQGGQGQGGQGQSGQGQGGQGQGGQSRGYRGGRTS